MTVQTTLTEYVKNHPLTDRALKVEKPGEVKKPEQELEQESLLSRINAEYAEILKTYKVRELVKLGMRHVLAPHFTMRADIAPNQRSIDSHQVRITFPLAMPGSAPALVTAYFTDKVKIPENLSKKKMFSLALALMKVLTKSMPEIALAVAEKIEWMLCTVDVFRDVDGLPYDVVMTKDTKWSAALKSDRLAPLRKMAVVRAGEWLAAAHCGEASPTREPEATYQLAIPVSRSGRYTLDCLHVIVRTHPDYTLTSAALEVLTRECVLPSQVKGEYREGYFERKILKPRTEQPELHQFTLMVCPLLGSPYCLRGCPHECENRRAGYPFYQAIAVEMNSLFWG